jgi:hypothetical protein
MINEVAFTHGGEWNLPRKELVSVIPIQAQVECADGPAGESTTLIVDPKTLTVTHVVVREDKPGHMRDPASRGQEGHLCTAGHPSTAGLRREGY